MNRKSSFIISLFILVMLNVVVFVMPVAAVEDGDFDASEFDVTISIPSIEVEAPIVTLFIRAFPDGQVTWDTSEITSEVGYLDGLPWFGEGGNVVLGGHSELAGREPSVFYDLDDVELGDEIIVNDKGEEFVYIVTDVFEVEQYDLSILYPTNSEQLTLMTCDTDSLVGGVYNRRVVVIAERA
jgi:LPXTG-site transpeptidase (sortase) family protein